MSAMGVEEKRQRRCASRLRWYYANREHQLRGDRARHARVRSALNTYVDEYLARNPCVDCGEDDPVVLDFDHVGEKSFNISQASNRLISVQALKAEIAKCEVRCSNCHRRKTHRTHGHRDKRRFSVPKADAQNTDGGQGA